MTTSTDTAVLVLAAGAGTRMRSDIPKVLHPLGGRSTRAGERRGIEGERRRRREVARVVGLQRVTDDDVGPVGRGDGVGGLVDDRAETERYREAAE